MARNKKHINDKFYTKQSVAKSLINLLDISNYDLIVEPSAGNGSFYNIIESNSKIGLDIDPENKYITKMNWFDFTLTDKYMKILIIGNPPFGNQGSLAFKFIIKASEIGAQTIAFILPKSFKKDSYKRKIPKNYILQKEIDLDDDSFTLESNSYKVPCVFQIWEKSNIDRIDKKPKTISDKFEFVKKSDSPDYAFRRVGFYAGRIYDSCIDKSEQSHYFIKSDLKIKSIIENIKWDHNNTAGPRSIGKSELINKIDDIISSK